MKISQASTALGFLIAGSLQLATACGGNEGKQGTDCDPPGVSEACLCETGAQGVRTCGSDVYATGNGGDSVVYHWQYCDGGGVAGNLILGLLSHLRGPSGAINGDEENPLDPYVVQIRDWFDTCLAVNNIQVSGTHPFEQTLQPDPSKYCR